MEDTFIFGNLRHYEFTFTYPRSDAISFYLPERSAFGLPPSSIQYKPAIFPPVPVCPEVVMRSPSVEAPSLADRLPAELLSIIFANLNYGTLSKKYLSSCSCVCRRWRVAALPHFFHAVRTHFRADERPCVRSCATNDGDGMSPRHSTMVTKTLEQICAFFASNPGFAAHVRELQLVLVCPRSSSTAQGQGQGQSTVAVAVDPDVLLSLLHKFPRLLQLKLYDVVVLSEPSSKSRRLSVDRLRVQFPHRGDEPGQLVAFMRLFALFGRVGELWIGSFGEKLVLEGRSTVRACPGLSVQSAHIEPLTTSNEVFKVVALTLSKSAALKHIECNCFREPFRQRLDYVPQLKAAHDPKVDASRMTMTINITDGDDTWTPNATRCIRNCLPRRQPGALVVVVVRCLPSRYPADRAVRAAAARILWDVSSSAKAPRTPAMPPMTLFYVATKRRANPDSDADADTNSDSIVVHCAEPVIRPVRVALRRRGALSDVVTSLSQGLVPAGWKDASKFFAPLSSDSRVIVDLKFAGSS